MVNRAIIPICKALIHLLDDELYIESYYCMKEARKLVTALKAFIKECE